MTGFEAFRYYISLKLHFTSKYDALKYNFKTGAARPQSYETRRDRLFFEKIGQKYTEPEIIKYYVSNLIRNKTWILDMDERNYMTHQGALDSFLYKFKGELGTLMHPECLQKGSDSGIGKFTLDQVLNPSEGHPEARIISLYTTNKLSLQTLACIDHHVGFINELRKVSSDPLGIRAEIYDLAEKYKPFLARWVDHKRTKNILLEVCTPRT